MSKSNALRKASQWILPLLLVIYAGYRFRHYQQEKSLLKLDDKTVTIPDCPPAPKDDSATLVAALKKVEAARREASKQTFAEVAFENQDYLSTISALQALQKLQPRLDAHQKRLMGYSMKECGLAKLALPLLREALQEDIRNATAYVALSQCLSRLVRNGESVDILNQGARNLDMADIKGRAELAQEYEMHAEWDKALEQHQEAFAHSQDSPDVGVMLARALQNSLKVSESQRFLEDLALRHPTHGGVQRELGFVLNSYQRKDRNAKLAEHHYLKAVALDPKDILAWRLLGDLYVEANRIRAAAYAYARLLQLDRYNIARMALARCYGYLGLDASKVVSFNPRELGIRDQAEYFMRTMRYTNPNSAKSLLQLPRHYIKYRQYIKGFHSLQSLYLPYQKMPEISGEIVALYKNLRLPPPALPAPITIGAATARTAGGL